MRERRRGRLLKRASARRGAQHCDEEFGNCRVFENTQPPPNPTPLDRLHPRDFRAATVRFVEHVREFFRNGSRLHRPGSATGLDVRRCRGFVS